MRKRKILPLFLSPLCLLAITGCSGFDFTSSNNGNSSSQNSSSGSSSSAPDAPMDDNPALVSSEEYKAFWNPSTYKSFSINMSSEAANFINTYQSNHDDSTYFDYYVPCTLTITIGSTTTTYEEVGIRQKGNLSRRQFLDNGHFSQYSLVHFKLNFQETFDGEEYDTINPLKQFKKTWNDTNDKVERENRTLFDMEKIDIKWDRNDDETKSKQSYGLKLFRDNGVLAGNCALVGMQLSVGNDSPISTTYEVLECIDKTFIKRHFNKDLSKGNLYKCTYTGMGPANLSNNHKISDYIGIEDNAHNYHPIYDLKTNKKKPDHTHLKNLITAVNDATSNESAYKEGIEKVLDMDEFIKYESIAYLLGNFDDLRNNANNYYLYFNPNGKGYVIPYDFDRLLGTGCEGIQNYMTNFSPESTKMQCNGNWQTNNLYWRTVCTSTSSESGHTSIKRIEDYRAKYQKNIEDILNNNIMSTESFATFVDSHPNQYKGSVNGTGSGNTTFANYLSLKKSIIKEYYPNVK